jgi:hypothetical protein
MHDILNYFGGWKNIAPLLLVFVFCCILLAAFVFTEVKMQKMINEDIKRETKNPAEAGLKNMSHRK